MKRIEMNKWFSLPRVGGECFSELRRAKVVYDPKLGFKFTPETDVKQALGAISSSLNEEYSIRSSCFICDGAVGEDSGPYRILCQNCEDSEDAYTLYTMKFASLMESA